MMHAARGTFTVQMTPAEEPHTHDDVSLPRMKLTKEYTGDLAATAEGQMLTARTPVPESAGYVATERVTGTLAGRAGSFVLQHSGLMSAATQDLSIAIVPDSGTGALVGIQGELRILIEDGTHRYELDYELPET